jgi:hypothetical protein
MALTSQNVPSSNALYFAGDYLFLHFSSTNTAQSGFRYKVTLSINTTQVFESYVRPNTLGRLNIDVSDIVLANMLPNPADSSGVSIFSDTLFQVAAPTNAAYILYSVQEYYSGSVQGSATTGSYFVTKGYGNQAEGVLPSRANFYLNSGTLGVLSVRNAYLGGDAVVDVPTGHPYLVAYPWQNFNVSYLADRLKVYDGTITADYTSAQLDELPNAGTVYTDGSFYFLIDLDPQKWSTSYWNKPLADYLQVYAHDGSRQMSAKVKINKLSPTERKNPWVSFTWLNEYGGYDFLLMDGRLRTEVSTDHQTLQVPVGNFGAAAAINRYNHTKRSYARTSTTTYTISKTHMEDVEVELARSLSRSEAVWMTVDGAAPVAVSVDSVDFDYNHTRVANLRPCVVQATLAMEERC